jgi:hypothetical protein
MTTSLTYAPMGKSESGVEMYAVIQPDNWDYRVTDEKRKMLGELGVLHGNCFTSSLITYYKMRKAGAIRVSGIRNALPGCDSKQYPHYWVEQKGKVFDSSNGQLKIVPIDEFYEQMGVIDMRVGNDKGILPQDSKNPTEYSINTEIMRMADSATDKEMSEVLTLIEIQIAERDVMSSKGFKEWKKADDKSRR